MIVSLPRYEGGSIEDHLRELFRISENNIKVKMSEREYKTYICHQRSKRENVQKWKNMANAVMLTCDEQSFLANGEVYQMMVKSEGVFLLLLKKQVIGFQISPIISFSITLVSLDRIYR